MNNEKKAKELTDNIWNCDNDVVRESIRIAALQSTLQMEECKDEQYKELAERNIALCKEIIEMREDFKHQSETIIKQSQLLIDKECRIEELQMKIEEMAKKNK